MFTWILGMSLWALVYLAAILTWGWGMLISQCGEVDRSRLTKWGEKTSQHIRDLKTYPTDKVHWILNVTETLHWRPKIPSPI